MISYLRSRLFQPLDLLAQLALSLQGLICRARGEQSIQLLGGLIQLSTLLQECGLI